MSDWHHADSISAQHSGHVAAVLEALHLKCGYMRGVLDTAAMNIAERTDGG